MNWTLTLILYSAIPVQSQIEQTGPHFDNYHRAHQAAKQAKKPMLMILQNGPATKTSEVSLVSVRKTNARRELLKNYVVVVIDANTPHGKIVHKSYWNVKLPHVVVLGNQQKYLIFHTSEKLYGQRWTEILTTYKSGVLPVAPPAAVYCAT